MRSTHTTTGRPNHAGTWLAASMLWCLLAVGCAPEIGDSCKTALDCSSQGSRICDRTQPGGYCTIAGCEQGTCPDEAVCVKFRPEEPRLASTYCMYRCDSDSDCREGRGYECLSGDAFGAGDMQDALVLDGAKKKFCGIAASPGNPEDFVDDSEPQPVPDAGEHRPDAGESKPDAGDVLPDAGDADAG